MSDSREFGFRYKEAQPGISARLDVFGWEARYVGKGVWQLIPGTPGDRCMTMTGNAVTLDAPIPINHRLVRFEWKHTNGAYADSVVATAARFDRIDPDPAYAGELLWQMYYNAACIDPTTIVPFGESYEYLICRYRLSFLTTNGHFVFPKLWIQEVRP